MTTDMMNLRDLVEKTPDADLLREMIGFAAERLMELEVGAVTAAAYGEKHPARRAQRNGYATTRRAFFERFLADGRIELDSNIVERTIRPRAITVWLR